MTIGELGNLVNNEWMEKKVDLKIIEMIGYSRAMTFSETGLE